MIEQSTLVRDLAAFADLGTDTPPPVVLNDAMVFRMFREGDEIELRFHDSGRGKIVESSLDTGAVRNHASYRALLATERFGNLRRWADNQGRSFRNPQQAVPDPQRIDDIQITGLMSGDNADQKVDLNGFDDFLATQVLDEDSVRIMLVDGPAGIGKTTFISALARLRAKEFLQPTRPRRPPLILHVESRGRVLTFLQDLIAFSLQRLRLTVTFDQLPVLVRHGLVTIAIDGFDELGDPNGYELAWSQVDNIIDQVRGAGTLILAGRETFIGKKRIRDNIRALRQHDAVDDLALLPPEPAAAKEWLVRRGRWTRETIEKEAGLLFEPGSYALRPVFLTQLDTPEAASILQESYAQNTLSFLVDMMIKREADKFGDTVNAMMDEEQRRGYIRSFLREVARYLAEEQTEALAKQVVPWLAEVAAEPQRINEETLGILKNRAGVMAFLANDDVPGYLRFQHSQLFNHFLAHATIAAIAGDELPKHVRRNLLGADFLASFSDLILYRSRSDTVPAERFFDAASCLLQSYAWIDRGVRNLGAMLIAILPALVETGTRDNREIRNIQVDETLIQGTVPPSSIRDAFVSQIDIRGADLRGLTFDATAFHTVIADDETLISSTFPIPRRIQIEGPDATRNTVLTERDQIIDWLDRHGRQSVRSVTWPMMRVLDQACRIRSHSFSEDGDFPFQRFTQDPWWPDVRRLLNDHRFLDQTTRPASGPRMIFFHIRRAKDLLAAGLGTSAAESQDDQIRGFYGSLIEEMSET